MWWSRPYEGRFGKLGIWAANHDLTAFPHNLWWGDKARGQPMRIDRLAGFAALTAILFLHPSAAISQTENINRPETVRLGDVRVFRDMKSVTVGNAQKHYYLYCNMKADGCITPKQDKNYLLFNESTRWKVPGATEFLTLAFMQDWKVKYNESENIGLYPEDNKDEFGVFILNRIEKDIILSDGPIIYGVGLDNEGRQRAWKHMFMQMVSAVTRQQGQDALGVKLARRCMPGRDFCLTTLDAKLSGIGGSQEPQKVDLMIATDVRDKDKQIVRMVCTWPNATQVCRDWDTGKITTND